MNYKSLEIQVKQILVEKMPEIPEMDPIDWLVAPLRSELISPLVGIRLNDWHFFNKAMGGLLPNQFTILCGPTGSGKTTWLANLSAKLLVGGKPHFVASVETGPVDFAIRVLSVLDGKDYNTGDPHPRKEIEAMLENYARILKSRGLILSRYTNKINPMRILCDLLFARSQFGCRVAILDNLNFFMPLVESSEQNLTMDRVVHDFVIFCKNIDMHLILCMHPRKTDSGRVETEFDIKGSSTAVQESHNILLFNRPHRDDHDRYPGSKFRELKFAKLRRRGQYVYSRIMYENIASAYEEREMFHV